MSATKASRKADLADDLPLIETKLVPPGQRAGFVPRARLLDELDRLSSCDLTLVVAPVGFGKTVLVQSWCALTRDSVAWVSLDDADNDPTRLWTYVATAVDRIRSGLGRPTLARLRSVGASSDSIVDDLVNGLNAYGARLAIVLDDLHVLTDEECVRSLERLVEHLPRDVRIIATTRADPAFALGRLRGRGALGEIRARSLSFTREEARQLLVEEEGISLDEGDVALLVNRTEGWPAGLYLALLWLREVNDPRAGVAAFHGDHRHVADYLTSEVLDALDAETRAFLLQTATLGSFSPQMCDEVLGRSDSRERLSNLEHENGFLIPLNNHGGSYRYHQLFGELLQLELKTADPDAPSKLHTSACQWCRENGLVDEALEHAAASDNPMLVAEILMAEHAALLRSGRSRTLLRWCEWLPDELLVELPMIPIAAALAAGISRATTHARRQFLAIAERSRNERPDAWTPYADATFNHARTVMIEDSLVGTAALAQHVVDRSSGAVELRVPALANLGLLVYLQGRITEARALAAEALDQPEAQARPHGFVIATATLSLAAAEFGDRDAAEALAHQAVAAAKAARIDETVSGGIARTAVAVALEITGRLADAEREAVEAEKLRRQVAPEVGHLHSLLVLAGIRAKRGRLGLAKADLSLAQSRLAALTDAGRLPELVSLVEKSLETAQAKADLIFERPSAAELSVLQLLSTELSQREIGNRLHLSLNTVKTHTRSLYRKLGVTSRDEAVRRAAALGLLDDDDSPG